MLNGDHDNRSVEKIDDDYRDFEGRVQIPRDTEYSEYRRSDSLFHIDGNAYGVFIAIRLLNVNRTRKNRSRSCLPPVFCEWAVLRELSREIQDCFLENIVAAAEFRPQ